MSAMPTDYIAEAITEAYGERCPDFAEGCACCEAWSQYDRLTSATPPDELSGDPGELIDKMADAIRGDTVLDDTPWEMLSEDRKIGWRGDAERALAVVKEYLTSQAATALRLSAGGGWRPMDSAPELDRVIVAGWQKPTRSCAGYWWMHEDVIINGQPDEYPDALLWHPFPSRPAGLPASPTVEASHVE